MRLEYNHLGIVIHCHYVILPAYLKITLKQIVYSFFISGLRNKSKAR